jgi:hypothetical protein
VVLVRALRWSAKAKPSHAWLDGQARDAERGAAEVTRYEVTDAIQVEEFEDEGSNCFLRLRDGRVLFLSGQHLEDAEAARTFPATAVEVSRSPLGRIVLDVKGSGEYLAPTSLLPPFPEERLARGEVPSDGDLVDAEFEAIRRGEAFGNRATA